MKLVEAILTKNPCYAAGRKITVKGLMLHSVGCSQPKASVFINSWNKPSYSNACVHGFIDANDGIVYQTLPWNHRGWHCASGPNGSGNNTHIGVEMCEPDCINYNSGSGFSCSDKAKALAMVRRTYRSAVELFAYLCEKYGLDPMADGVIISHAEGYRRGIASNHGDPDHLWEQLKTGYTMDTFSRDVKATMNKPAGNTKTGLQAAELKNLAEKDAIKKVASLFTADQKKSGILASVSLAQFILESGYGKSELAQNANNCFGMKKVLSGNNWDGSAWDGKSIYTKKTQEDDGTGKLYTVTADFRKYECVEDSIADHSAYLLGAMNGSKKRFAGLSGEKDYKKAAQIIKDGGYATSTTYVPKLCEIIERYKLTQYDATDNAANNAAGKVWYRVRKKWDDTKSQIGAYHDLKNAKDCADANPGYSVFDENGKALYTAKTAAKLPYLVHVDIDNLIIRKGPGTDKQRSGKYTGKGIFTVVAEADGHGASRWGLLKAYEKRKNGWVSLDFCEKV